MACRRWSAPVAGSGRPRIGVALKRPPLATLASAHMRDPQGQVLGETGAPKRRRGPRLVVAHSGWCDAGLNGRWATMTTDTIIETTTPSSTRVTPPLIQLPTELSARQPTSLTGDDAARICTAITAAHTSSTPGRLRPRLEVGAIGVTVPQLRIWNWPSRRRLSQAVDRVRKLGWAFTFSSASRASCVPQTRERTIPYPL